MTLNEMISIKPEEIKNFTNIPIEILPDMDSYYKRLGRHMADVIIENNSNNKPTSMILPVGPTQQYPEFAKIANAENIDLSSLYTFNMDEYCDWQCKIIPEDHIMNFKTVMRELFFDKLDVTLGMSEERMFFPDPGKTEEMDAAFDKYGPADVCYAGIGYHGHVAFNEGIVSRWYKVPEDEFLNARTHIVAMADDTFVINSVREAGGNYEVIPPFAVTIGMKDILAAKKLVGLFYCGHWQRTVFRKTLWAEPSVEFPGTFCKTHPDFSIIIDAVTAACPEIKPF